jgi:hypothetical protein
MNQLSQLSVVGNKQICIPRCFLFIILVNSELFRAASCHGAVRKSKQCYALLCVTQFLNGPSTAVSLAVILCFSERGMWNECSSSFPVPNFRCAQKLIFLDANNVQTTTIYIKVTNLALPFSLNSHTPVFTNNQQLHFLTVYYYTPQLLHVSTHAHRHRWGDFLCLLSYIKNMCKFMVSSSCVWLLLFIYFLWLFSPARAMALSRGVLTIYNDASQSVWLLWTSDQLVAETSTWQHTTYRHPCPRWDSNPRS